MLSGSEPLEPTVAGETCLLRCRDGVAFGMNPRYRCIRQKEDRQNKEMKQKRQLLQLSGERGDTKCQKDDLAFTADNTYLRC